MKKHVLVFPEIIECVHKVTNLKNTGVTIHNYLFLSFHQKLKLLKFKNSNKYN